jgi:hypothetical protein
MPAAVTTNIRTRQDLALFINSGASLKEVREEMDSTGKCLLDCIDGDCDNSGDQGSKVDDEEELLGEEEQVVYEEEEEEGEDEGDSGEDGKSGEEDGTEDMEHEGCGSEANPPTVPIPALAGDGYCEPGVLGTANTGPVVMTKARGGEAMEQGEGFRDVGVKVKMTADVGDGKVDE